jgi:hypothetical protein
MLLEATGTCTHPDLGHGEWALDDGSGALVIDDQLMADGWALGLAFNTRYHVVGVGTFSYGAFKVEAVAVEALGPGELQGPEAAIEAPPPPPPSKPKDECPAGDDAAAGGGVFKASAFDRRPAKETLTIGTMNAEWLFDGVDDPVGRPPRWPRGGFGPGKKLTAAAHLFRARPPFHHLRQADQTARAVLAGPVAVERGQDRLRRLAQRAEHVRYGRRQPPPAAGGRRHRAPRGRYPQHGRG